MTIESEAKVVNDQVAIFNAELAVARSGGKLNKAAVKRARAALMVIKKSSDTLRKDLQALVSDDTVSRAAGVMRLP